MGYQGSGPNGVDGLGLSLKVPKRVKRGIKKLGRGLKRVVRSPVFKGAVIGAAGGYIYGRVRKAQKNRQARNRLLDLAKDRVGPLSVPEGAIPTPPIRVTPSRPYPVMDIPVPSSGGMTSDGSGFDKVAIANKIMRGIPLTEAEMAYVRSGALGQGMLAAAETAYGNDMYSPGAGQPLPPVTVTAERDNTLLYAGLGLVGLLLLTQRRKGT